MNGVFVQNWGPYPEGRGGEASRRRAVPLTTAGNSITTQGSAGGPTQS